MGYYIQTPGLLKGKAQYIVEHFGGRMMDKAPESLELLLDNEALICVVGNGLFESAAFCYNGGELANFSRPEDRRPKWWLVMNKKRAEELTGFPS